MLTILVKALSWCPWKPSLLAYGAGTQDGHVYFRSTLTGDLERQIFTGCQVTTLHFSTQCKELVLTTGYNQPSGTTTKRCRKGATSSSPASSLAYITRPYAKPFNRLPTRDPNPSVTHPSLRSPGYSIVTYRYPSLEHVVTIPFAHSVDRVTLRPGRITMSEMSPDGTRILTAGNEMLALRAIWGSRSKKPQPSEFENSPQFVIR